jgi:DDE superfamily endonuclease
MAIGVPRIIWISGPWKGCGADSTIASMSGIKEMLNEGEECLLADKGYSGEENELWFVSPVKGHRSWLPDNANAYNYIVYSARQSIERVIRRMRLWTILHMKWRFSLDLHALVVKGIGKLTNLCFLFEPLG